MQCHSTHIIITAVPSA